jgi:hypothetical protein
VELRGTTDCFDAFLLEAYCTVSFQDAEFVVDSKVPVSATIEAYHHFAIFLHSLYASGKCAHRDI